MKSALKKFFAGKSAQPAPADNKEEALNMATKEETAELQALLEQATASLAASQAQVAEMSEKFEKAQAALKEIEDQKAAMVADAAAKRMASRKEKVVASVGTARADALLAATEALDDASFQAVVSAMAVSQEEETKTEAFKEVGTSAPEDAALFAPPKDGESGEAKLLKAKYQSNKGNK